MTDDLDALIADLPDLDTLLAELENPPAPDARTQTRREAAAILRSVTDSTGQSGRPVYAMSAEARRLILQTATRWGK